MEAVFEWFRWLIGGGQEYERLSAVQIAARTAAVYLVALVIIRIGKRRFMGNYSAFDILLGFIVGSVMARAITGAISVLDMVLIVIVLVSLHWLIATLSVYSDRLGKIVKSSPRKLMEDGEILEDALAESKITENDLMQALREKANIDDPRKVKTAYLERDGNITVIPKRNDDKG
jgi:uncharacterized membrane protein YcaP (DUF421 family)